MNKQNGHDPDQAERQRDSAVKSLRLLRILAWSAVAAIIVLSLMPGQDRPHVFDVSQLKHLAAYAIAGAVLAFGYDTRWTQVSMGICLTGLAGALELAQLWIPG